MDPDLASGVGDSCGHRALQRATLGRTRVLPEPSAPPERQTRASLCAGGAGGCGDMPGDQLTPVCSRLCLLPGESPVRLLLRRHNNLQRTECLFLLPEPPLPSPPPCHMFLSALRFSISESQPHTPPGRRGGDYVANRLLGASSLTACPAPG